MKNKIRIILVGVALVFSILACGLTINGGSGRETIRGSGVVAEENREVSNFSGVQLAMEGTLHLEIGSGESLLVEAEDNLFEYIETDVRAGKLYIETRRGINLQPKEPIHYYLTVTELDSIVISSSGDVEAGELQADSFSVKISSSGNLSIDSLDCSSLRVEISSSGDLEISGGQVQKQNITISSSGEYRAGELASVDAEVTLTSSGSATIRVSDRVSGRLSSSGNIYFIGNPEVKVNSSSSGKTVQIKE